MSKLSSYAQGEWFTSSKTGSDIFHAVSGEKIYEISSDGLDFSQMRLWAKKTGGPKLREMTFHDRALMLKALAQHLSRDKDDLYELSKATGASKTDSWIDIDGGIGTLFTYASKGRRECVNEPFYVDGSLEVLGNENTFVGHHICVPYEGVAVHINAFNFPCWGMLEKLAPTLLAGMPAIIKPASATSYLTRLLTEKILSSGLLPEGSLQIICGGIGDLLQQLDCQDVVTLTGSKKTGTMLKALPNIVEHSIRFNLEADSLNFSILAPDAEPGTEEFSLFIKEVTRELTVKAGQKCTAIRRTIVPENLEQAVIEALRENLSKISIGDPSQKDVKMGPLVSKAQAEDVSLQVERLLNSSELVIGDKDNFTVLHADKEKGAFFPQLVLHCKDGFSSSEVHEIEAFGPVSTIISYDSLDEAIELTRRGGGSLCGSIFTGSDDTARTLCLGAAPFHGRLLLVNSKCAKESTGHGSPLPHLVHGGPGRAGGGEELGGIRSVLHYMQRTAIQGSPQRIAAVCNQWFPGADVKENAVHPFRKYFDDLEIGDSLLTHRRTITEADVVNFAALSGDHFYAHTDAIAAKESIFEARVAHGYLVLSIAAGLFVDPAPGPVIANYGLENLRFIEPVYINDTICVRLTCQRKTPKDKEPRGVVHWDVDIQNQNDITVARYTILTLVSRKEDSLS